MNVSNNTQRGYLWVYASPASVAQRIWHSAVYLVALCVDASSNMATGPTADTAR